MVDFADSFPDAALMNSLGDDVTFVGQNGTGPELIKAVIDLDVLVNDYNSETQQEIEILTELLISAPQAGDVIVHGFNTYTLHTRLNSDGKYQRWSLKNA